VWADTLLGAERAHLQTMLAWGAASVVVGLVLLATAGRPRRSPLIFHFALQCVVWGAVEAMFGGEGIRSLGLRDLAAATQLDRLLWLNLGLDTGYVAVGAAVGLTGWLLARRQGAIGAGAAIVVHGLALFLLHARFLLSLERVV
jgi:hypothetical protein